jgi:hypothetical protein
MKNIKMDINYKHIFTDNSYNEESTGGSFAECINENCKQNKHMLLMKITVRKTAGKPPK